MKVKEINLSYCNLYPSIKEVVIFCEKEYDVVLKKKRGRSSEKETSICAAISIYLIDYYSHREIARHIGKSRSNIYFYTNRERYIPTILCKKIINNLKSKFNEN